MDRFEQIENIFQQACDPATDDRAAFLKRATNGDAALFQEVEDLFRQAKDANKSLVWESSGLAHEAYCDQQLIRTPTELGRYRLGERLGAGGMGVVYKAVRIESDIPQTVAIKILQAHPEDDVALARFVRERRILAGWTTRISPDCSMVGQLRTGCPFLAMEYVNGVGVTLYLSNTHPTLPGVLALFTKICSAVSYTHRAEDVRKLAESTMIDVNDSITFSRALPLHVINCSPAVFDFWMSWRTQWDETGDFGRLTPLSVFD